MTLVEKLAYEMDKDFYQNEYGWNDEQFDIFWNNPEKNAYVHHKNCALRRAEVIVDFLERENLIE